MKKALLGLAIGMAMSCSFVSYAGWTEVYTDQGVCEGYQNEDGTYKTNEWYQDEDGNYYYFGEDGAMAVNTITPDGSYVDWEGKYIPTGTQSDRTGWYKYTHYKTYSNVSFIKGEDEDIDGGTLWLEESPLGGINAIFYDGDDIYEIRYYSDSTYLYTMKDPVTSKEISDLQFLDDHISIIEKTDLSSYMSGGYMNTRKTYTR